MLTADNHRLLPGLFSTALALSCLLPGACFALDAPPPAYAAPPIEQALAPEGVFAMRLAAAIAAAPAPDGSAAATAPDIGPNDSARAEAQLSALGIEPKNGWLSEYPVTPAVLGELEISLLAAADQHKIPYSREQAAAQFDQITAALGLTANALQAPPAPAAARPVYVYTDAHGISYYTDNVDTIPDQYRALARIIDQPPPAATAPPSLNPDTLNNYYLDQGPPAVTYYAPPDPYAYLYSWVDYPFWSTGFYFPGFFILNNFQRTLYFNRQPYYLAHHSGVGGSAGTAGMFANPAAQAGAQAISRFGRNRALGGTDGQGVFHNGPTRNMPAAGDPYNITRRVYAPLPPRAAAVQAPVVQAPAIRHPLVQERVFVAPGGGGGGFHGGGNGAPHGGGGGHGEGFSGGGGGGRRR